MPAAPPLEPDRTSYDLPDERWPGPPELTDLQKLKMAMLTGLWQNYDFEPYRAAPEARVGRGYVFGIGGFSTGEGDALPIVRCLDAAKRDSPLQKYLPALEALEASRLATGLADPSTAAIDAQGNFYDDWFDATNSFGYNEFAGPMERCQADHNDRVRILPARAIQKTWGLRSVLATAILYDSLVSQGLDATMGFVQATNDAMGNPAQNATATWVGIDRESAWLERFLRVRLEVLLASEDIRIDRLAVLEQMRRDENFELDLPINTGSRASFVFATDYHRRFFPTCTIEGDGRVTGKEPLCHR